MHVAIQKDGFALLSGTTTKEPINDLVRHLRRRCVMDDNVTLLDIFEAVERSTDGVKFLQHYSWCGSLKQHHAEAKAEPKITEEDDEDDDISSLCIRWSVDDWSDDFLIYPDFCAMKEGASPDEPKYALDFVALNEVSRLPIRLDSTLKIGEHVYKKQFHLIDVMDAIYYEISWYGPPAQRNVALEHLKADYNDMCLDNDICVD